jgi:E1A/CREB-binding protein
MKKSIAFRESDQTNTADPTTIAKSTKTEPGTLEQTTDFDPDDIKVPSFSPAKRKMVDQTTEAKLLTTAKRLKRDPDDLDKIPGSPTTKTNIRTSAASPNVGNTTKVKRCKFQETPTIHHFDSNDLELCERLSLIRTIKECSIHRKTEVKFFKVCERWPCYESSQDVTILCSIYSEYFRTIYNIKENKPKQKGSKKPKAKSKREKCEKRNKDRTSKASIGGSAQPTTVSRITTEVEGEGKDTAIDADPKAQNKGKTGGLTEEHCDIENSRADVLSSPNNAAFELNRDKKKSSAVNKVKMEGKCCRENDSNTSNKKIKAKQQRLILLNHSSKCKVVGTCPVTPHCADMKKLWVHIGICCSKSLCKVPHCVSSRSILKHYGKCKDSNCPVCRPLRTQFRRSSPSPSISPPPQHQSASFSEINTTAKNATQTRKKAKQEGKMTKLQNELRELKAQIRKKANQEGKMTKLQHELGVLKGYVGEIDCSFQEYTKRIEETLHTRYGAFWSVHNNVTENSIITKKESSTCTNVKIKNAFL